MTFASDMVGPAPSPSLPTSKFVERRVAARRAPEDRRTNSSLPMTAVSFGARGMSSEIEPKVFGQRIVNFLRRRHPAKTAYNVARDTGCTVAQVNKWLELASTPNGVAFTRLIFAYGPELLASIYDSAPRWLDGAVRADKQARLESRIAADRQQLERLLSAR